MRPRIPPAARVFLAIAIHLFLIPLRTEAQDGSRAALQSPAPSSTAEGFPDPADPSEEELALQRELMHILEEETEIATNTKLNADYVPGIVSVLRGSDLEKLGARTVHEALGLVPGVESTINQVATPIAAVRGIGFDFLASHMKIMVDSIPVNQSFVGNNLPTMMMPIEQVDRIEVIRGPGSALYGEFALSGVINVITKRDGNRAWAAGGSFETAGGGGHFSLDQTDEEVGVWGSYASWGSDGYDAFVPEDVVLRTQPAVSNAPGRAAEDERYNSQFLAIDRGDFRFRFQRQRRENGRYFAVNSLQPDPDILDQDDRYSLMHVSQGWDLSDDLSLEARFTYNEGDRTVAEQIFPPGFALPAPPGPGGPPPPPTVFPDGLRFRSIHEERRFDGGIDLEWKASDSHDVLVRLNQSDVEITDNFQEANFVLSRGTPLPFFRRLTPAESGIVPPGIGRDIFSAAIQDQIKLNDSLTATVGGRYDDYSDVGDSFTPRIAAVWQLDDTQLLKAQYAEAFRPPSLEALNLPTTAGAQQGNPDLRPQTISTYELGYIYRKTDFVGRLTLYQSNVEDVIAQGGRRLVNATDFRFRGGELEADYQLDEDWRLLGNVSYFDYEDELGARGLDGVAQRLANLAVFRNFGENAVLTARALNVGDRVRQLSDPRPPLDGYTTVDLTLSLFDVLDRPGLGVRIGAKNLFDADVRAPALPGTYPDDLPRPGTTVWGQVSYEF